MFCTYFKTVLLAKIEIIYQHKMDHLDLWYCTYKNKTILKEGIFLSFNLYLKRWLDWNSSIGSLGYFKKSAYFHIFFLHKTFFLQSKKIADWISKTQILELLWSTAERNTKKRNDGEISENIFYNKVDNPDFCSNLELESWFSKWSWTRVETQNCHKNYHLPYGVWGRHQILWET